jgi:hypothetical protein
MNRGDPKQLGCPKYPGTPCRCAKIPEAKNHKWLNDISDLNKGRLYRDDATTDPHNFKPYIMQKTDTPSYDTPGYLPLKYMQTQ